MKIIDKAKSTGREVRRTRKIAAEIKPLSITSLLDVLTIVLAFMIKNVSMEAQKITIPERMVFPTTMSADQLEESMGTTVVKVYPDRILLGLESAYFGTPLQLLTDVQKRKDLNEYLELQSNQIEKHADKNQACLLVQADEVIPTEVITAIVEVGTGSYYKYIYFSTLKDSQWLKNSQLARQ